MRRRVRSQEQGTDLGYDLAESFFVLRGRQHWQLQNIRQPDKQLRVTQQALAIMDRWQQLLLDVNDQQRALLRTQSPPRVFGLRWLHVKLRVVRIHHAKQHNSIMREDLPNG